MNPRILILGPCEVLGSGSWVKKIDADFTVAVDGGLKLARRLGISPDLAVGDWDSYRGTLEPWRAQGTRIVTLARKKNQSDLAHALSEVSRQLKSQTVLRAEIILVGFSGGRVDHAWSNTLEIVSFIEKNQKRIAYLEIAARTLAQATQIFLSTGELRVSMPKRSLLSVFSVSRSAHGVRLTGLQYPLRDQTLKPSSRGLSNVSRTPKVEISVKRGILLIVIPQSQNLRVEWGKHAD